MSYVLVTANRNYSSWSLRPWALMRALGIPFEDRVVPFAGADNWADFRDFSPTGQVPVLIDGDRTIWDSLGIALYLAERHGGIWPADPAARAWAQCAVAEMHGGFAALRAERTMNVGVRVTPNGGSPALARNVERLGELWSEGLERFGGHWLAGARFGAVDAFYAPVAFRVRTYGIPLAPAAAAYGERLLAHSAMRDWEAAALAERWRDADHEDELAGIGDVTQDLRAAP